MAAIAVIMGGATGFISALVALILFNASWLVALGMWSLGGAFVALVLVGLMVLPRRGQRSLITKHA